MKKKRTGCLIVLVILLLLCLLFFWMIAGGTWSWRTSDYAAWHAGSTEESVMPDMQTLEAAQDVLVQRYHGNFWGEVAWTVVLRYDEQAYARERQAIEEAIPFVTERIDWKWGDAAPTSPSFEMDTFSTRLCMPSDGMIPEDPKHMQFIGFSDSTSEVLYVDYRDYDLDYLSGEFGDQLPDMIKWNTVRWPQRCGLLKLLSFDFADWELF